MTLTPVSCFLPPFFICFCHYEIEDNFTPAEVRDSWDISSCFLLLWCKYFMACPMSDFDTCLSAISRRYLIIIFVVVALFLCASDTVLFAVFHLVRSPPACLVIILSDNILCHKPWPNTLDVVYGFNPWLVSVPSDCQSQPLDNFTLELTAVDPASLFVPFSVQLNGKKI